MNPLLIAAIVSAIAGTVQGVGNATANDSAAKYNRNKLDQLLKLETDGTGLGLNPEQKRALDQSLNAPIAQAAQGGQQRAERLMAAAGGSASGADLSRLRTEATNMRADGAQQAAIAVAAADQAEEMRKRNEIEQRLGLKTAYRRDDYDAILGPIAGMMGTAGEAAGAPPTTAGVTPTMPGATPLPATGGPALPAADAAGAGEAIAGGAPAMMLARGSGDSGGGDSGGESGSMSESKGELSTSELASMQQLAEQDPALFARMFLASMAAKRSAA